MNEFHPKAIERNLREVQHVVVCSRIFCLLCLILLAAGWWVGAPWQDQAWFALPGAGVGLLLIAAGRVERRWWSLYRARAAMDRNDWEAFEQHLTEAKT